MEDGGGVINAPGEPTSRRGLSRISVWAGRHEGAGLRARFLGMLGSRQALNGIDGPSIIAPRSIAFIAFCSRCGRVAFGRSSASITPVRRELIRRHYSLKVL